MVGVQILIAVDKFFQAFFQTFFQILVKIVHLFGARKIESLNTERVLCKLTVNGSTDKEKCS